MPELPEPHIKLTASRDAGLRRLRDFIPRAGADYARRRNYDLPETGHSGVSVLSPYIRHRMVPEEEVVRAVLSRHAPKAAEKFIQEVYWRTYWKGWLERRPYAWMSYKAGLARALDRVQTEAGLRAAWEDACTGDTGIDGFDAWARELVQTGYMHNHARMWFASIWIFTLHLPWELGADFFMRHLLDGDPASNTLSWRWVAGLQTQGKNYVARAANISKYTEGRHSPIHQLASDPAPLDGPSHDAPLPAPIAQYPKPDGPWVLLLTEDDLSPGYVLDHMRSQPVATVILSGVPARSPLAVSDAVREWTDQAVTDMTHRYADRLGPVETTHGPQSTLVNVVERYGATQVVGPFAPTGPASDLLATQKSALAEASIPVTLMLRDWDAQAWPHASAGFFKFKKQIPHLLGGLTGLRLAS